VTQDEIYKIFAKFVVGNPTAKADAVVKHVLSASGGFGDPVTISIWYSQWRIIWTELAL
jgi:hypothetical protein